jgi:DNA-binding response OmpR family regulator
MRCGTARKVAAAGVQRVGPGPSRIVIDRSRWQVTRDGEPVHLTRTAFRVLLALVDAGGAVVTREDLYRAVWGEGFDGFSATISTHVCVLRRELGPDAVRSVRGVGYAIGDLDARPCEDWRDSARGGDRAPVTRG